MRWNPPFSIGIDTGAVYGGRLTAIRLPDETRLPGLDLLVAAAASTVAFALAFAR